MSRRNIFILYFGLKGRQVAGQYFSNRFYVFYVTFVRTLAVGASAFVRQEEKF
jgi:hypothetical protein